MQTARYRRWFLALSPALLAFCSCQTLGPQVATHQGTDAPSQAPAKIISKQRYQVQPAQYVPGTLPNSAWTGAPEAAQGHGPHAHSGHCPHCQGPQGPFQFSENVTNLSWVPDGIACPWPQDEFLCDGGDLNNDVHVKHDWTVVGLDREDTVAHYDTLDGQTEVTKSNCV